MSKTNLVRLGILSFVLFGAITIFFLMGYFDTFDSLFNTWIQQSIPATIKSLFIPFTHLGSVITIVLLILTSISLLPFKSIGRNSLQNMILIAPAGSYLINAIIKQIIQRPRPPLPHLVEASGYSFPSGHAMVGTTFYIVLAYVLIQLINKRRKLMISTFTILIILIAISRVILNVHYLSDIVAGVAAGAGCTLMFIAYEKNSQ